MPSEMDGLDMFFEDPRFVAAASFARIDLNSVFLRCSSDELGRPWLWDLEFYGFSV